jgi:comEA protein
MTPSARAHTDRRLFMLRTIAIALLVCGLCSAADAQEPRPSGSSAPSAAALNLNAATAEQLEALPGIGKATADRILEYRQKNGGFKKVEDLMNVRGIGEKSFLKLKPLITVAPARSDRTAP